MSDFLKNLRLFIASANAWLLSYNPPKELPIAEPKLPNREDNLTKFCLAIQSFEGYHLGSRGYRNCNPGNIRYTPFSVKELGAIGGDGAFAKWATYEDGFNALKKFVKMAATNQLASYHNCTIQEFFQVYAPSSDSNPTVKYYNFVASKVGYPISTKLSDFL